NEQQLLRPSVETTFLEVDDVGKLVGRACELRIRADDELVIFEDIAALAHHLVEVRLRVEPAFSALRHRIASARPSATAPASRTAERPAQRPKASARPLATPLLYQSPSTRFAPTLPAQ